jgi:hypothetical protein
MPIEQHISLGFSCQTRNTFMTFSAEHRTMPFDWCITTRQFVLEALKEGRGSSFMPNLNELKLYTTPIQQEQGLCSDKGIWFWHEFPRKPGFKQLADNPLEGSQLHAKFWALWDRFLTCIRDPHTVKRFVISNTQDNLELFTPMGSGDQNFFSHYGLDYDFLMRLDDALRTLGARNFTIHFMIRNIQNYLDFVLNPVVEHFTPMFVGTLSLPYHKMVSKLLGQSCERRVATGAELFGKYSNGIELVPGPYGDVLACDANGKVYGTAREVPGGYVFNFTGARDRVASAVVENDSLYFSDKGRWTKNSAHRAGADSMASLISTSH